MTTSRGGNLILDGELSVLPSRLELLANLLTKGNARHIPSSLARVVAERLEERVGVKGVRSSQQRLVQYPYEPRLIVR